MRSNGAASRANPPAAAARSLQLDTSLPGGSQFPGRTLLCGVCQLQISDVLPVGYFLFCHRSDSNLCAAQDGQLDRLQSAVVEKRAPQPMHRSSRRTRGLRVLEVTIDYLYYPLNQTLCDMRYGMARMRKRHLQQEMVFRTRGGNCSANQWRDLSTERGDPERTRIRGSLPPRGDR
jgi:hypothetical protein